jgi:uncharacterized membrane protein YjjB (DUF3815 family)
MKNPIELVWAGLATAGFAFLIDLRLKDLPLAVLGAVLGWWIYSVLLVSGDHAIAYFAAALVIGLTSEIGAALMRRPVFIYMVCSILPLVPGSGMYNTMLQSVRGDLAGSLATGFGTLQAAGAIAAGLAVSSALARIVSLTEFAKRIRFRSMHKSAKQPRQGKPE